MVEKISLIKDVDLLDDKNVPKLIGRRKEIDAINDFFLFLKPEKPRLQDMYIYGYTGTGKTLSIEQIVLPYLKKYNETATIPIHVININCRNYTTKDKILKAFAESLGCDNAEEIIIEEMKRHKKIFLAILDETNRLNRNHINDVLFFISDLQNRLGTTLDNPLPKFNYIAISNDYNLLSLAKEDTKSRWTIMQIHFKPYEIDDLNKIIWTRREAINNYDTDTNTYLCKQVYTSLGPDPRKCIKTLKEAAILAQKNGKEKIEYDYIDTAIEIIKMDTYKNKIATLTDIEKKMAYIIRDTFDDRKRSFITTGEIRNKWKFKYAETNLSLSRARIYQLIKIMESKMIVSLGTGFNSKGKTTRIMKIDDCLEYLDDIGEKYNEIDFEKDLKTVGV